MAQVNWFSRLASAAARIDKAEAAAEKAARQLERVRRPDLVRKYERAGKAAEARRAAAEREFKKADRALSRGTESKRQPSAPLTSGASYMVTVDYRGRRGHTRYVEFVLHAPRKVNDEQVRRAVSGFSRGKPPEGWTWSALRYGTTESNATGGRVRDLDELQGLLMQQDSITVGEL